MRTELRLAFTVTLVASTALALPSVASAQGWLEDRARTEGPGFRVGDFELHPGIGVELGYDNNLYYTEDEDRLGLSTDTAILRATAHLLFSTRGAQRQAEGESGGSPGENEGLPSVTFRGGLSGSFYHFFNANDRTNMEVDASLALTVLPGRPFSFSLFEDFSRSIRPFSENLAAASFARIQNNAGLDLNFATTGDVLKITLGYRFALDFFEAAVFQYGNSFRHTIQLNETFRFLPQTAIVHDTAFTIVDIINQDPLAPTLINDGYTLRSRIGLNGALTQNFSVLGLVGYEAGFFESRVAGYDQDYESLSAQAEARWQIAPNARLVFGYDRGFQPSFVGNFFRRDRGYIASQLMIEGVFLVGADVSLGYYEFGAIIDPNGMLVGDRLTRGDIRLIGSLFAEYRFTDWLGVNGTFRYTGNFTDYEYLVDTMMTTTVLDPAQFNKIELWLGVRVFY